MKNKLVLITLILTTLIVMLGLMMFTVGNTDATDDLLEQFNKSSSQLRRPITVEEITRQIAKEEGKNDFEFPEMPSLPTMPDAGTQVDTSSWMSTLDSVHKAWGKAGFIYTQTKHQFTEPSGNSVTVRTDCSGYIGYCLYKKGVFKSPINMWSGSAATDMRNAGLLEISSEDRAAHKYQAGDILVYKGHIEAFVKDQGTSKPVVYNWGGKDSVDNKYTGVTDFNSVNAQGTSGHTYSQVLSAWRFK